MAAMDVKERRREVTWSRVIFVIGACLMMLGLIGGAIAKGALGRRDLWDVVGAVALLAILMIAALAMAVTGWGRPPAGYEKRLADAAQWRRWYNCLYT